MNNELVEAVARAMAVADLCDPDESSLRVPIANAYPAWRDYVKPAKAAIALIRPAVLEEAAHPAFLRPLIEEQSAGEWDDKTIDRDVAMFSAAIRALKDK
jgi:hypothetical protein